MKLRKFVNRTLYGKNSTKQFLHFLMKGHIYRHFFIRNYSKDHMDGCLQIGGGYHLLNDWLNGDLIAGDIYINAEKRLPFQNNSLNAIFAEQFIEHLSFSSGIYFLKECYRVLKDDGKIRIATPDLKGLIQVYLDKNSHVSLSTAMARHRNNHNHSLSSPCHFINDYFRLWGHAFIYDENTLTQQMAHAGFQNIRKNEFGHSEHSIFEDLERHADVEWMKDAFLLILEGSKLSNER